MTVKNRNTLLSHKTEGVDAKLLSDVIHKIKNGLGGIGGFAALLERDLETNDPRKRLVQRIQDGVFKVNEFVVHLMTLARVPESSIEKVRLRRLVKEVCRATLGNEEKWAHRVLFHPDLSNGKFELHADSQIIRNSLHHSIRFIRLVGGRIETIKVYPQLEDRVNVELTFNERKRSWKFSDDIFKLVKECEPVEARLSLAIVLKLIELCGGEVSIVSVSKSQKILTIQLGKGN